jgi:hypothetical protein
MRNVPCLAVAIFVSSCGAGQMPQAENVTVAAPSTPALPLKTVGPWDASGCGDDQYQNEKLERHPALAGLSPGVLIAAYGKPAATEDFVAGEPSGTFYGAYGKQAVGEDVGKPVRVLTWTKNGCNFSVFFIKKDDDARAVEAFEWAVGADF